MKKNTPKGFGGGGRNKKPPETSISGISNSNAYILGIASEGEIEGPINGLQSVYFDETPIQNADGSINFQGFSWDYRTGTQWQSRIPGFADNDTRQGTRHPRCAQRGASRGRSRRRVDGQRLRGRQIGRAHV